MIRLECDAYGHWSWALLDGDEIVSKMGGFDSRDDAVEGVRRAYRALGSEEGVEQKLFAAISASREEEEGDPYGVPPEGIDI